MAKWMDIDAPDTAWRPGAEDPIPLLLGRHPVTAFGYRFATGRPLDGHARTNATFLHPGTKPLTRSGWTAPYNYWPGWKRGLLMTRLPAFGLAPYSGVVALNEWREFAGAWWMHWEGPALAWLPLAAIGGTATVNHLRIRSHRRNYLEPLERAAISVLRTRDRVKADIPRELVRAKDVTATGRLYLPPGWAGQEGDRDQLLTIAQDRLGASELDARFNLEGRSPHMELYVPPQPPDMVSWDHAVSLADDRRPYLGESATGPVFWDLDDVSPHAGVVGGSGSGKTELIAWIVAQFMRGGAGVVVLDPKGTSHRWLLRLRGQGVLYCEKRAMLHDTIMWLDSEMDRRGQVNVSMDTDVQWPRLVVLLEERNSLQDKLRDHWAEVRTPGQSQMSPAIRALDRLSSMGRTLDITVVLAGQETAQVSIGKKGNYGAWAIAGRFQVNHWRNIMGPGSKKPSISGRPGRFGWAVQGHATVFQAAYPDLDDHAARLQEWATSGKPILDVMGLMQQRESAPFPSSTPVTTATEVHTTLAEFAMRNGRPIQWFRSRRDRDIDFPKPIGTGAKNAALYREDDLSSWMSTAA